MSVAQFFAEGGFMMWPVSFFGCTLVVLGVLSVISRYRTMCLSALGMGCFVLLLGVAGMMLNRLQVERAVENVPPEQAARLVEQGHEESKRPAQLGGAFALLGLAMGGFGFARSKG
ncbi:MAG: hypothetical protein IPJ65_30475 [Archangiaceae bacterium]|nr:hypothetical protein [Archangiaceae bacterium]